LVFWKLIDIFVREFYRLVASSALVHWGFAVFTFFGSLSVGPDFLFTVSISHGVVALVGDAHALVSDAISLVLLLSEIHDTTKSFVVSLEDGKIVVSVVLISILNDSFEWIFN